MGWRAAAVVGMVVVMGVGGLGSVEEVLANTQVGESSLESFWMMSGMEMEEKREKRLSSIVEKSSKDLYQLLLGKKDTRAGLDSVFGMYLPTVDITVVKNMPCILDLISLIQIWSNQTMSDAVAAEGKFWHLMLPDSWGKAPDGILYGNVMPWGMQEECTIVNANEHIPDAFPPLNAVFRGRYCLVSVGKDKSKRGVGELEKEGGDVEGLEEVLQNMAMPPEVRVGIAMTIKEVPPIFSYGTCMPSSCTPEDLEVSINHLLNPVGKKAKYVDCHVEDETNHFNTGDIVFTAILSVLGAIMLFAAIVDLSINYSDAQELRQGPLKFLLAFSAYSNLKSIFAIRVKEHKDVISCLHGLRVFSMAWVVWGHGYMMQASATNNLMHSKQLSEGVLNQIVMNATYSVDSFLFMSGLVVTYSIMLEKEKAGHINWILYYIHRFLRLSPPIIFTAAATATVFRFFMTGPFSHHVERGIVQGCRDYWWADAFFFNNFIHKAVCLPQCWYTAVDFQLFAVAPLVLAPLLTRNKLSLVWLGIVTLVSVAVPMINIAVYDLTPPGLFVKSTLPPKAQVDLYMTPWARAGPYLIGIWTGWILIQVRGKTLKIPPVVVLVGWLVSAAIALSVLFGMADYNVISFTDINYASKVVSILYGGLSRLAWGVSLMWVVFACHTGYGGIANSILSHPSLQPMSRLTYSLFLVTIPVQIFYLGAIYMPLYVTHFNKIVETCGYLFLGGLVGIPLTLAVERPILVLERLIIRRKGHSLMGQKEDNKKE